MTPVNPVVDLSDILSGVSFDNLWATFATAVPFIVLAIAFVFGYALIRRLIKGASKGKLKV